VLTREPARADREGEATVRDVVDRARHLCDEARVLVGVAQDEVAGLQGAGDRRRSDERGESLEGGERLIVTRGVRRHEVVGVVEAMPAARVHQLDDGADVVPRRAVAVHLCA